jgi:hypothetical protein
MFDPLTLGASDRRAWDSNGFNRATKLALKSECPSFDISSFINILSFKSANISSTRCSAGESTLVPRRSWTRLTHTGIRQSSPSDRC